MGLYNSNDNVYDGMSIYIIVIKSVFSLTENIPDFSINKIIKNLIKIDSLNN